MKDQLEALVNQMIENHLLFEEAVGEFERRFMMRVLEKNKGNLSKTAKALGIHRNTLSRKLAALGLNHRPKRRRTATQTRGNRRRISAAS